MMDLLCVSFRRDVEYAHYLLRSIEKFATGFRAIVFDVPIQDVDIFRELALEFMEAIQPMRIRITSSDEWPGKGMIYHEWRITCADQITDADIICHIDADCVFTAPVTPETYAPGGKPILRWESYESISARHPAHAYWCEVTARNLPFKTIVDTMKCHGASYTRRTYSMARNLIHQKTGMKVEDYLKTVQHTHPEGYCEFVTLGNVALRAFPNDYIAVEQDGKHLTPDNCICQCWSRAPVTETQDLYVRGGFVRMSPLEFCRQLGIA